MCFCHWIKEESKAKKIIPLYNTNVEEVLKNSVAVGSIPGGCDTWWWHRCLGQSWIWNHVVLMRCVRLEGNWAVENCDTRIFIYIEWCSTRRWDWNNIKNGLKDFDDFGCCNSGREFCFGWTKCCDCLWVYSMGTNSVEKSEVCLVGPPSEGLITTAVIWWTVSSYSEDNGRSEIIGVVCQLCKRKKKQLV